MNYTNSIYQKYQSYYLQKVRQFERVVILRNGKLRSRETYGPGLIFYLPCIDSLKFLDLRVICHAVDPQEVSILFI